MILIDSREQQPLKPVVYSRANGVAGWRELPTERATLAAGDYSVRGLEHLIAVERKSIPDLYGTLYGSTKASNGERIGHQDRFRNELERLLGHARRWWLIEGSPAQFDFYIIDNSRRVNPADAHALIAAIACDYGIPTIWAGDRRRAAHWLGCALSRIDKQASDAAEQAKARRRGFDEKSMPWLGATAGDEALKHAEAAARGERA